MQRHLRLPLIALALAVSHAANAQLIITPTFTSNVDTRFGANAQAFKDAFTYSAAQFTSIFSDPIHINITVDAAAGTSVLGQSNSIYTSYGFGATGYNALRTAAIADATSADDLASIGAGGSLNPTTAGGSTIEWFATKALEKALNLRADDLTTDGTVTFGAGLAYSFDPNNRAVAGKYDLIGTMMHEISEVMGRQGDGGITYYYNHPSAQLLDAFRYMSPGVRGLNNGAGDFFSINAGSTLLLQFNDQASLGGDSSDWATVSGAPDSFDAFGFTGQLGVLSATDLRTLDVIGYNRVAAVPLPASAWLLLSGLAAMVLVSRRRREWAVP